MNVSTTLNKLLFVIAGLYDGALGIAFLFFAPSLFQHYQVTPPNHLGYVQFPALILIVFGVMFLRIASDPRRFRDMIPFGMGLKVAYAGIVFYYALTSGIPSMWLPWAWGDSVFLLLFVAAWTSLGAPRLTERVA